MTFPSVLGVRQQSDHLTTVIWCAWFVDACAAYVSSHFAAVAIAFLADYLMFSDSTVVI